MNDISEKPSVQILGLIPARGGSKEIPHKNRRLLAGKPLIDYTFASALGSHLLTRLVLTTDDPQIAELGRAAGIEVPFLRPNHLSEDTSPIIGVIYHALDWLAQHEGYAPDIIVLLQPTSPLRQGQHIDDVVTMLMDSNLDSVVSVSVVPSQYHPCWQFVIVENYLKIFTGEPISELVIRRQELSPTYSRNGAVYAFTRQALESSNTIYGEQCGAYIMPPEVSVNLDSQMDWDLVEAYLTR